MQKTSKEVKTCVICHQEKPKKDCYVHRLQLTIPGLEHLRAVLYICQDCATGLMDANNERLIQGTSEGKND